MSALRMSSSADRAVMGRQGDPDAASDDDLMAAEIERLVEHLDDPLRQGAGVLGPLDVDLQDGEFVSTEPRNRVGFPNASAQPGGDRAQQRIADRMAERIVHVLELVQVEAQHGLPGLAPRAQQRLHHELVERGAVWQLRERIVTGHVLDLGLGQRPLGDVLMGGDPPASVHRLVDDGDRPAVRRVDDLLGRRSLRDAQHHRLAILVDVGGEIAGLLPVDQQIAQRASGPHDLRGEPIHLDVAAVADDQAAARIEHAEALRHVVEGGVEPLVLQPLLLLLLFQAQVLPLELRRHDPARSMRMLQLAPRVGKLASRPVALRQRGRQLPARRGLEARQPEEPFGGAAACRSGQDDGDQGIEREHFVDRGRGVPLPRRRADDDDLERMSLAKGGRERHRRGRAVRMARDGGLSGAWSMLPLWHPSSSAPHTNVR